MTALGPGDLSPFSQLAATQSFPLRIAPPTGRASHGWSNSPASVAGVLTRELVFQSVVGSLKEPRWMYSPERLADARPGVFEAPHSPDLFSGLNRKKSTSSIFMVLSG